MAPAPSPPSDKPEDKPADKPSGIGLALGGGVARGWAHIGVLQRLDELNIKPDIVCGTSVGALVGGFWLAGCLPNLENWTRSLNKRRMLSYLDIALNGSGLIGGKRLEKALRTYLPDIAIEDLPTKFTAVTTELTTGHEIWLRKGSLRDAIRAAYALPGIFPPNQIGGRWLIDGALVNPLPISACRAMDTRLVIAVGLHAEAYNMRKQQMIKKFNEQGSIAPIVGAQQDDDQAGDDLGPEDNIQNNGSARLVMPKLRGGFTRNAIFNRIATPPPIQGTDLTAEQIPGLGEVMLSSFNVMMDRTTRARVAADPPDILISPKVGHIPLFAFDEADALIALGRQAVDDHADEIFAAIQILS